MFGKSVVVVDGVRQGGGFAGTATNSERMSIYKWCVWPLLPSLLTWFPNIVFNVMYL